MSCAVALHKNMSMDDAVRAATQRGFEVRIKNGTGDYLFTHRLLGRGMRVNCRRKDVSQALVALLRKAEPTNDIVSSETK